jgi:ribosomal-protein-alanine N-acetyltransferase
VFHVRVIRERTDKDLPACVEILRAVHQFGGYPINWPADPDRWLTPPAALGIWVAVEGEQVVGHVVLTAADEGAEVERLFVDPSLTGRGLGRQLLDHCVATADDLHRPLALDVVDNRGPAVHLYRKAGWQETGREPIDWGGEHATELIHFTAPARNS